MQKDAKMANQPGMPYNIPSANNSFVGANKYDDPLIRA